MSLFHNEFDARKEVIFITYEDVIKSYQPTLLRYILDNYPDKFSHFINIDKIKRLDQNNLIRLCIQRTNKNILEYLAIREFDYELVLKTLKSKIVDLYFESPILVMGDSLNILLTQKFVDTIYIYSEEYDPRIHEDLIELYNQNEKIRYVVGDFSSCIRKIPEVTTFILNDVDYVLDIINEGKEEYSNILIANYGYNYILNEETDEIELRIDLDKILANKVCKHAIFTPLNMDTTYFTQL